MRQKNRASKKAGFQVGLSETEIASPTNSRINVTKLPKNGRRSGKAHPSSRHQSEQSACCLSVWPHSSCIARGDKLAKFTPQPASIRVLSGLAAAA
eukprot:3882048-Amphidinium_carterae.1